MIKVIPIEDAYEIAISGEREDIINEISTLMLTLARSESKATEGMLSLDDAYKDIIMDVKLASMEQMKIIKQSIEN